MKTRRVQYPEGCLVCSIPEHRLYAWQLKARIVADSCLLQEYVHGMNGQYVPEYTYIVAEQIKARGLSLPTPDSF